MAPLLLCLAAGSLAAQPPSRRPVHIVRAVGPIAIDGVADEPSWVLAQKLRLLRPEQVNGGAVAGPQDLSAVVRYLFDDEYLYVHAEVTDDRPRVNAHTDGLMWQGDSLETYIGLDAYDPSRTVYVSSRNYQWTLGLGEETGWFIYRPSEGPLLPPAIPYPQTNLAVRDRGPDEAPGYVLEARLPWRGLPDVDLGLIPPRDGSSGALMVAVNDNDDPSIVNAREKGIGLTSTTEAYHDPSTWVPAVWGGIAPPEPGDLNGSGAPDILDVIAALRIVARLAEPTDRLLAAADLNGNGRVEVTEVLQILRAVARLGDLAPVY